MSVWTGELSRGKVLAWMQAHMYGRADAQARTRDLAAALRRDDPAINVRTQLPGARGHGRTKRRRLAAAPESWDCAGPMYQGRAVTGAQEIPVYEAVLRLATESSRNTNLFGHD